MSNTQHRCYVGVGFGNPSKELNSIVKQIAESLNEANYVLRSDGEDGVSALFAKYASEKEIYLPYKDYNNIDSELCKTTREAEHIASRFHPCFNDLKSTDRKAISRYSHVMLGKDLRHLASFMICYTDDKAESIKEKTANTGIIGQAIAIASAMAIPVYNLAKEDCLDRLNKKLNIHIKL